MYDEDFYVKDQLDPGNLLERFLSDCQKLGDDAERILKTVRGKGYLFVVH